MEAFFLGMPDVTPWLFVGFAMAAFGTTFLAINTGTATGLILLALLAMVFPLVVVIPMHTLVMLGATASRVIFMREHIITSVLLPFTIGCIIGAVAGAHIFISVDGGILLGFLAVFILVIVWTPGIGRMGSGKKGLAALGFAATFLGMFVSSTGALVASVMADIADDRRKHVATMGALMGVVHIAKVVAFGVLGVAIATYLPLIAAMIVGTTAANWIGRKTLAWMDERWFRIIFKALMTVLAVRLLWNAAGELGWIG